MSKYKEKASITIYEKQKINLEKDLFFTIGRKKLSTGIEYSLKGLEFLLKSLLKGIKGKFTFEEIMYLQKIIDINREEMLDLLFKKEYNEDDNIKESFFNIDLFTTINNMISDDPQNIEIYLNLSKKIIDLKNEEIFALISFLFNYESITLEDKKYIADTLVSNEEYQSLLKEWTPTKDYPDLEIPQEIVQEVKASLDKGEYKYENGRKIIINGHGTFVEIKED